MASSTFIQKAYIAFFNRPADKSGYDFWLTYPGPDQHLLDEFAQSPEYLSDYAGKSNHEIISTIYQNLFGRAPEPEGLNYWAGQMTAGWVTVGNAAYEILGGAQGSDLTIINDKTGWAQGFTDDQTTPERIDAYAKAGGNGVGHVAKDWLATVGYHSVDSVGLNVMSVYNTLLFANDTPYIPEYRTTVVGPPSSDFTWELLASARVHDNIKWDGSFSGSKLTVVNFDAFSATGKDSLDFTEYGAKWLGAATLNASGNANSWVATSIQSSLSANDKYITLTRADSATTEYKIELWTKLGSDADAYHAGPFATTEAMDTAQLIGYLDIGRGIDLSVAAGSIVF